MNAVRFLMAGVLIGAAAALSSGLQRRHLQQRFVVLGGVFATYFVLMFYGLQTAAPVNAAAVFTLTPVLGALFGWLMLRQVTTWRMASALTTGALWVIFRGDFGALMRFEIGMAK